MTLFFKTISNGAVITDKGIKRNARRTPNEDARTAGTLISLKSTLTTAFSVSRQIYVVRFWGHVTRLECDVHWASLETPAK